MHKLKYLIIFRHGPTYRDGFLTIEGFSIIGKLASHLMTHGLVNSDTHVICSSAMRAMKSAQYFSQKARITTDEMEYEELFSLEEQCDVPGAIRVIQEHAKKSKAESLVVFTHLEMLEQLPHAFGKEVLGTDVFPCYNLKHGEGFIIDCEKKTCELVTN